MNSSTKKIVSRNFKSIPCQERTKIFHIDIFRSLNSVLERSRSKKTVLSLGRGKWKKKFGCHGGALIPCQLMKRVQEESYS